jgi:GDPmannose 4,6-dehydratase
VDEDVAVEQFDGLYRRYAPLITAYVRRRVDPAELDDVVAQVFVVAWRRLAELPEPPADRLWLYGVARRTIADHRRSGLRRLRLEARLIANAATPFESGDLSEIAGRVEAVLRRLRPADQEILRLVLGEGLTHAEAAIVLGCSANAVELRLRRARSRAREILEPASPAPRPTTAASLPIIREVHEPTGGPMRRALITGITGQDGRYLAELLIGKGYEVHGMVRGQNNPKAQTVRDEVPEVELIDGDLTDLSSLIAAVEQVQPDEVYNLGAISFVKLSFSQPDLTANVSGSGVLRMLEAIRIVGGSNNPIRFYQASSSEMFGMVHEVPQRETTPFHPRSPYGTAKVFGYYTTLNYRESYGIHASNGILFNHTSPRRGLEFVERKITNGVARISLGLQSSIALGNLDSARDFGYAGDYVEAMWQMLQQDDPADYVVATGRVWTIREVLTIAFKAIGIDDWTSYVESDPRFLRPADVDQLTGESKKAGEVLGWAPKTDFADLLQEMVRHDLALESARAGLD